MHVDHGPRIQALSAAIAPRAAGLIVTLYGDVVEPRGGEVWMGSIVEACAGLGISETLVRTAVSRLVAAGQLEGWRRGRRSFYRLTEGAAAEYAEAARLIYGPPEVWRWRFLHLPDAGAEALMARLERQGYARLRPNLALGPARGAPPPGLLAFDAEPGGALEALPDLAAQAWDLAPHARAYRAFFASFAPVQSWVLTGAQALSARLLLVHAWRQALLADPRLPPQALPVDWPGHAARALFHRLYATLSPEADSHIGARFEAAQGHLPVTTEALVARLAGEKTEPAQGLCPTRGDTLQNGAINPLICDALTHIQ